VVRANGSYPLCPGFKSLHRHHPFLKRFRASLASFPILPGQRVLVAVSGGGDSVGLLALFLSVVRPSLTLGVSHVHHNLRGEEADRDEAFVHDLAASLALPFFSLRLTGKPGKGESLEEWARVERYAALEALRTDSAYDWVATAHQVEDQAETLLLRIWRGTGLDGLAGILPASGRVVRPVLGFTRAELREASEACGLPFIEDASNADRRLVRNRVRLDALPALERALPGFQRKAADLARRARGGSPPPEGAEVAVFEGDTLYYPCGALINLGRLSGLCALRSGLRRARGDLRRIGERHLDALWALTAAAPGATVTLPGGWEAVRERRGVRIRRSAGGWRREAR
jgi:tRNA(Ile)-lysidine synthetase-like protein